MKAQKSKWLRMLVLVALLTTSLNVNAQQVRGKQLPPKNQMEQRQRPKLERRGPEIPNLTEEQKSQLKAFRMEEVRKTQPIQNIVAEKEARLNTLSSAAKYDEKAVNKVIEEIGGLRTDLLRMKVASQYQIKSILTEEEILNFNKHQPKKGKQREYRRR